MEIVLAVSVFGVIAILGGYGFLGALWVKAYDRVRVEFDQ